MTRVLDFTCEKSGEVLTVNVSPEEDIRLCRIANGDEFDNEFDNEDDSESENENKADMTNHHDDHHKVTGWTLPLRLKGVSLSG